MSRIRHEASRLLVRGLVPRLPPCRVLLWFDCLGRAYKRSRSLRLILLLPLSACCVLITGGFLHCLNLFRLFYPVPRAHANEFRRADWKPFRRDLRILLK